MSFILDIANMVVFFKRLLGLLSGFVCFALFFLCISLFFIPASHSHRVPMCLLLHLLPFPIPPLPQTYCLIFRQATAVLKYFQNFSYVHVHTPPPPPPSQHTSHRVFVRAQLTSPIAAGRFNVPPDLMPPPLLHLISKLRCLVHLCG